MANNVTYTTAYRLQAQAIVDEMIARGIGLGGGSGGGGGGDASAFNQTIEIARLEAIRDKLPAFLVEGRLATDSSAVTQPVSGSVSVTNLPATQLVAWTNPQPVSGNVSVANFPATQVVSAQALPLPNGAATDAVASQVRDRLPPTLASGRLVVDGSGVTQPVSGTVAVNNFPVTQPVSGTVAVSNFPNTQAISATALPLPNGATTETTLALIPARIGNTTDTAATTDTGTFSLIALIKRVLSIKLPSALSSDRFKVESQLTSTARTTSFTNTTAAGTIAAGANSVAIANIGSAAGTVKTVSLPAGATISFAANGNDTLDAIAYSATNTNFLITTVI